MKRWKKYVAMFLAFTSLTLLLTSCGVANKRAVGLCGDHEILYEEVRFEAMSYRQSNPDCSEEELRSAVEQAIRERYAILELCKEFLPEVSPNSDALKEMAKAEQDKAIEQLGSKKEFKAYLKESYLTKHLLQSMLIITQMQLDLETALFENTELKNRDTLLAWLKDGNCARICKITLSDLQAAQKVQSALKEGSTVEELKKTELLDNAYVSQPDYYFRGLNNTPEETAAMTLSNAGDVSEILNVNGKYSLFIRLENDFENLENYQVGLALERYRENRLTPMIQEKASSLTVSWNKIGLRLVLRDLK